MIKKLLLVGFASCLLLTACSNDQAAETTTIVPQESKEATAPQERETTQTTNQNIDSVDKTELDTLTTAVTAIITKVNEAVPNGTAEEQMAQFLAMDTEIEKLEDQLDLYDDQIEASYHATQLTAEQYNTLERDIEALENQLDHAEDTLELTFNIVD